MLADHIGQETPLPSIELCIEEVALNCGAGYGCAYYNTISWRTTRCRCRWRTARRSSSSGCSATARNAAQRLARKQQDRSILDAVTDKVARLQSGLDVGDRARLGEYLDDVREIERRIQKAEKQSASNPDVPEAPVGVPEAFEDHIKLMFDLQVLAYQAEITRVSTMMYARDTSGATYPGSGVRDGFHTASHHSNARARMDSFALINRYHVQMLGYFLEKLRATPDGDGNLLDHSVVLYGSSMSNGNQHDHDPLPILVAGGASGQLKGDRHLAFPAHTPMSNLMLSLLDKLGVRQDSFGDSTGSSRSDAGRCGPADSGRTVAITPVGAVESTLVGANALTMVGAVVRRADWRSISRGFASIPTRAASSSRLLTGVPASCGPCLLFAAEIAGRSSLVPQARSSRAAPASDRRRCSVRFARRTRSR